MKMQSVTFNHTLPSGEEVEVSASGSFDESDRRIDMLEVVVRPELSDQSEIEVIEEKACNLIEDACFGVGA